MTLMNGPERRGSGDAWTVAGDLAGTTLAAALRRFLPEQSWRQIRALVHARRVQLNDRLCIDDARRVSSGDSVTVLDEPAARIPGDSEVVIRHIDDSIVVIEKPSGMLSLRHVAESGWPAKRRLRQPSADEVVLRAIGRVDRMKEDPSAFRPAQRRKLIRSVHRIDRDTSGLLVFARTHDAEQHLIDQFSKHSIRRVYQAIVPGRPTESRIATRLVRDRGDGLRGSTSDSNAGKTAVTHLRCLETCGDYSLMECELETGRTHQIRIHLAEAGHPVCGDTMYRAAFGQPCMEDRSGAPRLALHARELTFTHPLTEDSVHFESTLPRDLTRFLSQVRSLVPVRDG